MRKIFIPHFAPDRSHFAFDATYEATNCLPTQDGWGPSPSLNEISASLGADCLGAITVRNENQVSNTFAGTANAIFRMDPTNDPYTWDDVSKAGGYNVPIGESWSFSVFGNDLIAHTLGDNVQTRPIASDSSSMFADLAGNPPVARYSWVVGDFLMLGWLDGEPNAIQWSGVDDSTYWGEGGLNGADKQIIPDGQGVVGGVGEQNGAIVFQRDQIRYAQFSPTSGYVFTRSTINSHRGVLAPRSIAQYGPNQFAFLSLDGFYANLEGSPIGVNRVDKWFFDTADPAYLYEVTASVDPFEKIIWWRFRGNDGYYYLLGYNWQLDRWCFSNQQLKFIFPTYTVGVTWDGLSNLYPTIDDVNVPFDSRLFKGGAPTFGGFTVDNKLAYFTGENQAVNVRTHRVEHNKNRQTLVTGARLDCDSPDAQLRVRSAHNHAETPAGTGYIERSPRAKDYKFRKTGMLHEYEVTIPEGSVWTNLSSITPYTEVEGDS